MTQIVCAATSLVCSLVLAHIVHAQRASSDETRYGATATVERPLPSDNELDPTVAATTVNAADARADDELDELLNPVAGARTARFGGPGAFSSLSLRGAEATHTQVVLDSIPLGPVDGGAFDLSTLPPALLERVEVYRGGAPLWLGSGAIGGVLRLVPASGTEESHRAMLFGGSYGMFGARVHSSVADRNVAWLGVAGTRHSNGDFSFEDNNNTPFVPEDDHKTKQRNAELDEGFALMHGAFKLGRGRLSLLALGLGRSAGVPGPAAQPTLHTHRTQANVLMATRYGQEGPRVTGGRRYRVELVLSAALDQSRFTDLFGEIGLGQRATRDRSKRFFLRSAAEYRANRWLALSAIALGTLERLRPHDALARVVVAPSKRDAFTTGAEIELAARPRRMRLLARPSFTVEVSRAQLFDVRLDSADVRHGASVVLPNARLGLLAEVHRGVALTASIATAGRIPTFVELFGDRGYLVGDTELRTERGLAIDGGLTLQGRAGALEGTLEARAFALRMTRLIRYRRTSLYQAVPENVGRARTIGTELGMRGEVGRHFGLTGQVTWMRTEDDGRDLPLRPRLQAYARPDVHVGPFGALDRVRFYVGIQHVGAVFADPANIVRIGPRTELGTGVDAEFFRGRVIAGLALENLTDSQVSDVLGFPLPGRSFSLTVSVGSPRDTP